jgi:hypothetical protein
MDARVIDDSAIIPGGPLHLEGSQMRGGPLFRKDGTVPMNRSASGLVGRTSWRAHELSIQPLLGLNGYADSMLLVPGSEGGQDGDINSIWKT